MRRLPTTILCFAASGLLPAASLSPAEQKIAQAVDAKAALLIFRLTHGE